MINSLFVYSTTYNFNIIIIFVSIVFKGHNICVYKSEERQLCITCLYWKQNQKLKHKYNVHQVPMLLVLKLLSKTPSLVVLYNGNLIDVRKS